MIDFVNACILWTHRAFPLVNVALMCAAVWYLRKVHTGVNARQIAAKKSDKVRVKAGG